MTRRRRPALWLAVIATLMFCLFPLYWLVNVALRTGADLSTASLVPPDPTLKNFGSVLHDADFLKALRNSAVVTAGTTLIAVSFAAFAGYALARLRFRRKFPILAIVLSISTFPPIAVAAPLFKLFTDIGLYNTYPGLIIPSLTFALPLAVYILTSFFKEIPKELEEAALIDGATHFQAFRKIIVPLSAPGVVTAGLLTFIFVWNEFLFAITLTSTPERRTVPAALAFFTGSQQFEVPLGTISAASILVTIPIVVLVITFQRRIVQGLVAGAVKG